MPNFTAGPEETNLSGQPLPALLQGKTVGKTSLHTFIRGFELLLLAPIKNPN